MVAQRKLKLGRIGVILVCLICVLVCFWVRQERVDFYTFDMNEFVDSGMQKGIGTAEGPAMYLPKGSYVFALSYQTDSAENKIRIESSTTMDESGNMGVVYAESALDPQEERISLQVNLEQDVTNLRVCLTHQEGQLAVTELSFRNLKKYNDPAIFCIFFILILLSLYSIHCNTFKNKEKVFWKEDVFFLLFFSFLTMLPYLNDFLIVGHDLQFHLARIEGISEALKNQRFPVKINPIQANGYGNASSVMYPQLFLYLPAVFRLFNLSLMNCYKVMILEINLLTAICSFLSFKNIWKSREAGFIGCSLYMMGLYRLDDLYIRAAIGEAFALAFLPVAFWGIYEILYADEKKWPLAALGFSLVLQSHILSTEIYVGVAAIAVIASFAYMDRKAKRFLALLMATGVSLLWNLGFIIPFLEFLREDFAVMGESHIYLPDRTVYLSQIFTNFEHSSGEGNLPLGTKKNEMPLTLGLVAILGPLFFFSVKRFYAEKIATDEQIGRFFKIGKICFISAVLLTLGISWLIPWDVMMEISLLKKLASTIQFLWRLLGIIYFFLCCTVVSACAIWMKENVGKRKQFTIVCVVFAIIMGWPAIDEATQSTSYKNKEAVANTNLTDYNYLYIGDNLDELERRGNTVSYCGEGNIRCLQFKKEGTEVTFEIVADEDCGGGYVEVPLYYYPHYRAFDGQEELTAERGDNGVLRIELPEMEANSRHQIAIDFYTPVAWKIGYLISAGTILFSLLSYFYHKKRMDQEESWEKENA